MLVGKFVILLVTKTAQMEKGLKKGGTLAQQFKQTLTNTNKQLLGFASGAAGVYAVVHALQSAVRASDEFNKSMNFSLAILNDLNRAQATQMRLVAQTSTFGTRFKPQEAAKGLFYLESAGFTAKQATAALPAALEFTQAAGGMFELSQAVDLLTDAQVALGLVSEDTTENLANMVRVSDALVGANTLASATVQQFSEALTTKAAASARMLGKDMNEALAVLAAFAQQGKKGAAAGTALTIVWRDLRNKAIENEEAFRNLGVRVYDDNEKMRHTSDILKDLEKALGGASDKLKTAAIQELGFTIKTADATTMLIGMSEQIRKWNDDLDAMAGKTKEVSDKMQTEWGKLKKSIMDIGGFATRNTLGSFIEEESRKINVAALLISRSVDLIITEFSKGAAEYSSPFSRSGKPGGGGEIESTGDAVLALVHSALGRESESLRKLITEEWKIDIEPSDIVWRPFEVAAKLLEQKLLPDLDAVAAKAETAADAMETLGESVAEAILGSNLDTIAESLKLGSDTGADFEAMSKRLAGQEQRMELGQFDLLRDEVAQMRGRGLDPSSSKWLLGDIDRLERKQQALDATTRRAETATAKFLEQNRVAAAAFEESDRFRQQFETPEERFGRLIEDIGGRLMEGLDLETAGRALTAGILGRDAALGRDLQQPTGPAGVTQGTQAAFALEMQKRTKDTPEKQLRAQEEANVILEDIREDLAGAGLTVAPIRD